MRQELQICRLEVAHLVHRIGTVEHIQEQLLALLINPQGGAQRAAAQGGMQGQPGNQGQGGVGEVLESLYKQICESRHSGDAASLGGLGAYGAAAVLAVVLAQAGVFGYILWDERRKARARKKKA